MPRQLREILASVRETGDRDRNTGAPGKYGRSGNPNVDAADGQTDGWTKSNAYVPASQTSR